MLFNSFEIPESDVFKIPLVKRLFLWYICSLHFECLWNYNVRVVLPTFTTQKIDLSILFPNWKRLQSRWLIRPSSMAWSMAWSVLPNNTTLTPGSAQNWLAMPPHLPKIHPKIDLTNKCSHLVRKNSASTSSWILELNYFKGGKHLYTY